MWFEIKIEGRFLNDILKSMLILNVYSHTFKFLTSFSYTKLYFSYTLV